MVKSKDEIEKAVIEMAKDQFGIPPEKPVTRDTRYAEDLNADSLDAVECCMDFEDEFEVSISDEEIEKVKTVGDAVDLIATKLETA